MLRANVVIVTAAVISRRYSNDVNDFGVNNWTEDD
jgi:hypothetical protein